ncbi:MAG TPA: NAD(P)-dependent oxidoreductase [Nitrososphaera sp.]|nr:NAD(P)-dependent oxidoreductase [Nitrososphaera sp.]
MRVGVAGLGFMGSGMASRLIAAGNPVFVHNRSRSKAERFSKTAELVSSPKELAEKCDFIISVVTDFDAARDVLLGEDGVVKSGNKDVIVADASTISPSQSQHCARALRQAGIDMLGMPVMGGPAAAQAGELVPIVAGPREAYDKVRAVIEVLGKPVFYIGEKDGAANAIKLALNLNIALIACAVSEGITLVRSSGLDPSLFLQILNSTYFKTGLSEKKGPKMVRGEFDPSFHMKNMLKDLELASDTAQAQKITLPQTSLAQQMYRAASNSGFSEMDYTAICAFLTKINGMESP